MENIAKVYFINDYGEVQTHKAYHYFALVDDLEIDDRVVVETRNGYKVVSFGGYIQSSTHASAYIIQKINVEAVNKAKEKQKEIADLKKAIDAKAKEITKRMSLDALAKEDESLQELLDKFDGLTKGDN